MAETEAPAQPAVPTPDAAPEIPAPSSPPERLEAPAQMTPPEAYDPPPDLPEVEAEATCETDVEITVLEPKAQGVPGNRMHGFGWCGVKEVEVTLSGGGQSFSETTGADGSVTFSAVPCGAYTVSLAQDQFKIDSLDTLSMTVTSTRKRGREKEIKIRRQLLTVEMFRLPTLLTSALLEYFELGTRPDSVPANQDIWGHHWFKMYASVQDARVENPNESYGWWPVGNFPDRKEPVLYPVQAVRGKLNAGQPFDPYHTKYKRADKALEDVFFPWVTNGQTADEYKAELRSLAQGFESSVSNEWSWRTDAGGWHCKTFQAYVMRNANVWRTLRTGVGDYGWSSEN